MPIKEMVKKVPKKNQWYVRSEPKKKYSSRKQAENRASEILKFKHMR